MSTETQPTKAEVIPTIKCSWAQLQANTGLTSQDMVPVADIGRYGFDDSIVADMREFGMFPQPFHICGITYVAKAHIAGVVNGVLRSTMTIHRDFLAHEAAAAKFQEYVTENKIDGETAHKLATGEITIDDVRATETVTQEDPTCSQ